MCHVNTTEFYFDETLTSACMGRSATTVGSAVDTVSGQGWALLGGMSAEGMLRRPSNSWDRRRECRPQCLCTHGAPGLLQGKAPKNQAALGSGKQ